MFDPTQTQPLSWRMHNGQPKPWEEPTVEPTIRPTRSSESAPPERLADRGYRLRARLGSGRLGAVYEAQDDLSRSSGSQHFVAIQLIDGKIASRPGFAADFERGARELQSIAHPNILKLLEYGRDHDRFYLVNELLESASLRFVLSDVPELPLEEASAVMRGVGDALQHLHAKSIVHGNVRPENVLVTFGYEIKLLDLVPSGWLDNPADALGVPARQPDKRDDVFGLACLAYEMLAGRHPFNGNTAQEAHRAGLEAATIPRLSARQWRALSNGLALHRDDRTPNVAQFLDEFGVAGIERLRSIVSAAEDERPEPLPAKRLPQQPLLAERPPPVQPRRSGVGGALLFLAVIGVAALAFVYQDRLREQAAIAFAAIDARLEGNAKPDAAAPATAGQAPTTDVVAADASLSRVETVTDPPPALVLAPGATAPVTETSVGETGAGPAPTAETPRTVVPASMDARASTLATGTGSSVPAAAAAAPAPRTDSPAAAPGVARFSFLQPVATVREDEVAARIVIRRTGDTRGAAAIAWWTGNGTAMADDDYADLGARVERFEPGEQSRTVYVPLTNDRAAESTKSFNVYLGRGDSAESGAPLSGMRVDIVDDD